MRASTKKVGSGYHGVIRDAKNKVVWECSHLHRNRDQDSGYTHHVGDWKQGNIHMELSANSCAEKHLREIK